MDRPSKPQLPKNIVRQEQEEVCEYKLEWTGHMGSEQTSTPNPVSNECAVINKQIS